MFRRCLARECEAQLVGRVLEREIPIGERTIGILHRIERGEVVREVVALLRGFLFGLDHHTPIPFHDVQAVQQPGRAQFGEIDGTQQGVVEAGKHFDRATIDDTKGVVDIITNLDGFLDGREMKPFVARFKLGGFARACREKELALLASGLEAKIENAELRCPQHAAVLVVIRHARTQQVRLVFANQCVVSHCRVASSGHP